MVSNLNKGSHSVASNHRISVNSLQKYFKEEDIFYQLMKDIDLDHQDSYPSNNGQEESNNRVSR